MSTSNPFTITPADIPPSPDADDNDTRDDTATEQTCNWPGCKQPVSSNYSGRGRRPTRCDEHRNARNTTSSRPVRSSAKDTDAALAQMEVLYGLATGALLMVNPVLAADFSERIERAQTINRNAFNADPKLAKRVASGGSDFGPLIFLAAQVYLVGPTVRVGYDIVRERTGKTKPPEGADPFHQFATDDGFPMPDPHAHVSQNGNGETPAA
jgi:hypothetical protein